MNIFNQKGIKMKISEFKSEADYSFLKITDRLMEVFGVKNLKDLSAVLDVNYATFSTWLRRDKIPYELLVSLSVEKKISLDWLLLGSKSEGLYGQEKADDNVVINSYVNKDLKNIDILAVEEHLKGKHYLSVSQNIIEKFADGEKLNDLRMITVIGTSMSPTINHGDKVFISSFAEDEEIYNSIIYLVIYNGRTYIKRIQINPVDGKIRLVSDNEKYETFEIPLNKQKDLKIVGRVIFKCTFEDVI
jgi:phage repressor protein C with HTH and peptisase S24 domain